MQGELAPITGHGQVELWAALHSDTPFRLTECERHCLIVVALAADWALAAHLLLSKVRLGAVLDASGLPLGVARLDSLVAYRHGTGGEGEARLCHPSATVETGGNPASVAGLLGVGLIGLEAGQTVLWPGADGRLKPLEILSVDNGERDGR